MIINKLTRTNGFKIFLLGILILLFLFPVGMIRGIIYERSQRARQAEADIMDSWGKEFLVLGPIVQIPCKTQEVIRFRNETGEEKVEIRETAFFLRTVPEKLKVEVQLGTEIKKRGIFSVPLFAGNVKLTGHFDPGKILKQLKDDQKAFPEEAELLIALASQRGIRRVEQARWNEGDIDFVPGNQGFSFQDSYGGIHGHVPVDLEGKNHFDIRIAIQGGKSLLMAPLGEDSALRVQADWSAPSFHGGYLPISHTIDLKGFDARWEISHLSRTIPLYWTTGSDIDLSSSIFGVHFYKTLDHYDMNTRAVKYALLFIIIPFLSLFLFELFLRRAIHPVQYLLSGIGNVLFYLLLLSFSEHIPFSLAYWIAGIVVTIMMGLYSHSLLGDWRKTPLMGLIMILCYTFLYFTLQSEDWALLIGSLGAFGITGIIMFLTRKLDWYGRDRIKPREEVEQLPQVPRTDREQTEE